MTKLGLLSLLTNLSMDLEWAEANEWGNSNLLSWRFTASDRAR